MTDCLMCPDKLGFDWPESISVEAPPGKSSGLRLHAMESCQDNNERLPEDEAIPATRYSPDEHRGVSADTATFYTHFGIAKDVGVTECVTLQCQHCDFRFQLPQSTLSVGEEVEVEAVLTGTTPYRCPTTVNLQVVPFGCAEGTIRQFLLSITALVMGTILIGLALEALVRLKIETLIEGCLEVDLPRGVKVGN